MIDDAPPRTRPTEWLALVVVLVLATIGWDAFRFLTDDAYIFFRYADQWLAGRGIVFNPAPFEPVEGYTSPLWLALVTAVWAVTGLEPPVFAEVLGLLFGWGTLAWAWWFARARFGGTPILVALGFALVLSNRTFLTWMSSGLETSMFNFLVVGWTLWAWRGVEGLPRAAVLVGLGSALALTRPEGMGWALTSVGLVALLDVARLSLRHRALAIVPFGLPLLHLGWRRWYYGEWVPNTYYAKVADPWPEAGLRYFGSFVVEYGVWCWLGLVGAALIVTARRGFGRPGPAPAAALALLVGHWGYYTFVVGGDHFEYRVYSHLPVLFALSAIWAAKNLAERTRTSALLLALYLAASLPVQWTHWLATRDLETRASTRWLAEPIAEAFPPGARAVMQRWDAWQRWLIVGHFIGMRHQEHRIFLYDQLAQLPPREEGARIAWEPGHPVHAAVSVGVKGWVMPNVAVVDKVGLVDRVVAKNPDVRASRKMAHIRQPPAGYLECLQPNVETYVGGKLTVRPRPLPDATIEACQAKYHDDE